MFRALSLIIQITYLKFKQKEQITILIDDIGEGLDFERANNLIKYLIKIADTLDSIYQLVPKRHWKKSEKQINRTINALDYENLYFNTKDKVPSLNQLINELDNFFIK